MAAVAIDVFLGLVTYPGTRFPSSSGERGLTRMLAAELDQRGFTTEVAVMSENAWTPELLPITRATVERSIVAELQVEAEWRLWHSPRTPAWFMNVFMTARRFYRRRRYLPSQRDSIEGRPGFAMVRRLVNIELAHMALLREARDTGARWVLILEDDGTGSPVEVADMLTNVMSLGENQNQPLYVNVSSSFTEKELRIDQHLDPVPLPAEYDSEGLSFLAARKPVTNTVCAVLYRGSFLELLVSAMDQIPIDPVIPIDWKLNRALMDLWREQQIHSGDCWIAQPAPIIQSSMHGP